jgi:indole-3-glycerol phosphate synthase
MSDVLAAICERKRQDVAARKRVRPLAAVMAAARSAGPARGFQRRLAAAIGTGDYALIAEIKKASPSKGLIRADFDPPALARAYAAGGAACLSVLTEGPSFQGDDRHLVAARGAVDLPVLRKDFTVDPYQAVEARALGADCILLIMAAVEDRLADDIEAAAAEVGLDVLIEVHDRAELDRARARASRLIGINNRDLKTLAVDVATTETLVPHLPAGATVVSESGLSRPADLARLAAVGVRCFLVGEALMRAADVAAATRALLAGDRARARAVSAR